MGIKDSSVPTISYLREIEKTTKLWARRETKNGTYVYCPYPPWKATSSINCLDIVVQSPICFKTSRDCHYHFCWTDASWWKSCYLIRRKPTRCVQMVIVSNVRSQMYSKKEKKEKEKKKVFKVKLIIILWKKLHPKIRLPLPDNFNWVTYNTSTQQKIQSKLTIIDHWVSRTWNLS